MDKSTNTNQESILLKIADNLIKAQQELDEFAVQLSLGKAEATEKFEEIKKELVTRLSSLKQIISSSNAASISEELKSKISMLQLELATGKTETKSSFDAQKKKIISAIYALEETIKEKLTSNESVHEIVNELEKFKIKLEILRLKFVLKKFELKTGFHSEMKEAGKKIEGILKTSKEKWHNTQKTYTDFRQDISEAYGHIRKAVNKIKSTIS